MLGSRKSTGTTLISQETVVVGDIHFCGNLDIEGLVQGNIIAHPEKEALLRVVGKGRVEGEIRVPNVVINGEVRGNVYSSKHLELAPKSRVEGSVYYAMVEMAAGAEVNGSLTHSPEVAAVALLGHDEGESDAKDQSEREPGQSTKVD